jgi:pimeloyl-ACP methyl ester carboxylesterase
MRRAWDQAAEADATRADATQALAAVRPLPARTFFAQMAAAARWRVPARCGVPLLVLASQQDELTSVECSRALAAHLGAALRIHPSAGHDLPTDDPVWAAARVREWLDAGMPQGSADATHALRT